MVLGKGFGCWNTMPTSRRSPTVRSARSRHAGEWRPSRRTRPGSRRTRSCTPARREWEWRWARAGRSLTPGASPGTPDSRPGSVSSDCPTVRPLSSEPPRNVRLGLLLRRFGEQLFGAPDLHEVPQIKEGRVIGDARGLLEVVRHDADRVAGLELVAQLLDVLGAGRVERRRRLVEQQNVWLGGERPRHAEALLLAA